LIGGPPQAIDLVVVTTHLNQVLHHEPNDLTISVGAGMTMGALRAYLAQHGQMLPVDPALPDATTIGGMIATAADGPRRAIYGMLRDMMIGIEVIEVNGQRSRAGGMVVKNVSGFDMMKLYHGSFGTLALIVSANFKLVPIPPVQAGVLAVFSALADADAFVADVMASQLVPVTCELIDGHLLNDLGVHGAWGVFWGARVHKRPSIGTCRSSRSAPNSTKGVVRYTTVLIISTCCRWWRMHHRLQHWTEMSWSCAGRRCQRT
jgi:glycolate oxidase FAD binding subunit